MEKTQITPVFPRSWYTFTDVEDPQHIFEIDLTWLTSTYSCHFGTDACQGISAENPDAGCCVHGAFLSDEDDRGALAEIASQLTDSDWQLRSTTLTPEQQSAPAALLTTETWASISDGEGTIEPWLEWDELDSEEHPGQMEPALKTKTVNGACVFANRSGFEGGTGCSLHSWALRSGTAFEIAKPEVCWQLPLRRDEEYRTRADGTEFLHTKITEYTQLDWGDGGADFDWYCTEDPACHSGSTPLWQSAESELRMLIGDANYEVLATYCSTIPTLQQQKKLSPSGLPFLAVHPATEAAQTN